jgi:pimeloyl-CoA synthetase
VQRKEADNKVSGAEEGVKKNETKKTVKWSR